MGERWDVGLPEPEPIDWAAVEVEMSEWLGRPWKRGDFVPIDGQVTEGRVVFPAGTVFAGDEPLPPTPQEGS